MNMILILNDWLCQIKKLLVPSLIGQGILYPGRLKD